MDFIKELHEARLTRNESNVRVLTYTDCCERLYLIALILELLRRYPQGKATVKTYATKTVGKGYDDFKMSATDLYNFIYFVTGDDNALNKLKNPGQAKQARKNVTLPLMALNRYLRALSSGATPAGVSNLFMQLEGSLKITNTDYKLVRRNILNYQRISPKEREDIVTRLIFAARAKLRSADIIDDLSKLVAIKDLETGRIADPEPTVSTPDITVSSKDLALYRQLVGTENLMMSKRFIDYAKTGKGMPPQMVKAYLPIIQMIDEIVEGGSSYVQMLRTIHKRAKNQRKS
jgi:hypothetical protein